VLPGHDRLGAAVCFVRCYHDDDPLHGTSAGQLRLAGQPLDWWMTQAGIHDSEVWDAQVADTERSMWNARLFPAEREQQGYCRWLWMLRPADASASQFCEWAVADRYSFEEMALLADVHAFHARRTEARTNAIRQNMHRQFRSDSGFSAADLAYLLGHSREPSKWLATLIAEVRWQAEHAEQNDPQHAFAMSRIVHTLGSAIAMHLKTDPDATNAAFEQGAQTLPGGDHKWLQAAGLTITATTTAAEWAARARQAAFEHLRRKIITSSAAQSAPRNALRPDEIVWGRAPARLDLGGGWTDTPPYALERGGCVLNAAVELNGQPPIQAFARVTREPLIRVRSIDVGTHVELHDWDQLMNCAVAAGEFSLVQAALAISGFSPANGERLSDALQAFGGGLEITTLAAIPKGSGLGTSSIMGAVLLAVINRVLGHQLTPTELFHGVLRLEQKLTTGGGWQDQIGGSVGGLKLISTQPAVIPEATIRYVPADVLDPHQNGGQTLLYYTGITRLAKNILQQVVGRYLDRDRAAMRVLSGLHEIAPQVAEAMARKDIAEFGRLIDQVWALNKRLDPESSNPQIESMLDRVRPRIHGAKLLGAGGGGFLLLICKSPADAVRVREALDNQPPNERARFFDFAVSSGGLSVSVC
jgi:galactokinase/mevalonate kinase-like predicted kinase